MRHGYHGALMILAAAEVAQMADDCVHLGSWDRVRSGNAAQDADATS